MKYAGVIALVLGLRRDEPPPALDARALRDALHAQALLRLIRP